MTAIVALAIVVPLVAGAIGLAAWRRVAVQRAAAVAGSLVHLAVAIALVVAVARGGPLAVQVGGWPAGAGIQLSADLLGALIVLATAILGAACCVSAIPELPRRGDRAWPLIQLLVMAACGAALTADLFNLFVWFEVMLIASFVLLTMAGRPVQLRGGYVYVLLSLLASAMFLSAIGLLYGAVRTLDMTEASARLAALARTRPYHVLAIQALLTTSFAIKAAVVPLHVWLPASYPTAPPVVSALFAGVLTKLAVYALIRVTASVFPPADVVLVVLAVVGAITMLVGVAGALAQDHLRRILSVHIVSQIGYMVAGLALVRACGDAARFALAATIFFVVHNMLVKANLFLIAGAVRRARGTEALDGLGGVAHTSPVLALAFVVSALSLAGVPPLSGFWGKLLIVQAAVGAERWLLAAAAVITGLGTLASMIKIWQHAFAGTPPRELPAPPPRHDRVARELPIVALAALVLAIGLVPGVLFGLADGAAAHLLGGAP